MRRLIINTRQNRRGCLIWTLTLTEKGYGRLNVNGIMIKAHRLSYTMFYGKIPKNKVIDHLCRNRACINPAHLQAVSNKTNIRRGKVVKANKL